MKRTILLFEDRDEQRELVHHALLEAMRGDGEVKDFRPGIGGVQDGTHETKLEKDIQTAPNAPADLIVRIEVCPATRRTTAACLKIQSDMSLTYSGCPIAGMREGIETMIPIS